jgi:hypothetical protein
MMPKIRWPQRVASDAVTREDIVPVVFVIIISSLAAPSQAAGRRF